MRYSIVALAAGSTPVYAQGSYGTTSAPTSASTTCSPIAGTIVQPSGAPQITACANSLKLGDACGSDEQCPAGVQCWGSNAGTIRACGNFNAGCTSDSQCAYNTCNNGLCNGFKATSSSSSAAPTSTSTCAAPGTYNAAGQYSCNPAHQYPAGQTCTFVYGCPVLVNSTSSASSSAPSSSATSTCPAPGSTNSMGQYSCNPAHTYPSGQTCQLVNGCYYLVSSAGTTGTPPSYGGSNTTLPAPTGSGVGPTSTLTPYTGSASVTGALSGVGAIVAGIIAFVL